MRVWYGYGTEHSMNLKLIGHFKDAHGANAAAEVIKTLTAAAEGEQAAGRLGHGEPLQMFSDEILAVLTEVKIHSFTHTDVEQFLYEADVKTEGSDVVVKTDEIDVIAFVKVLLDRGAKVEMYSMHDHSNDPGEQ